MFYQPDKKMTVAILTNYHGAKLYDVAKALYESLPGFTCGNKNRKEDKIIVCFNGNSLCVDRNAAAVHIKKGAWLGGCRQPALTKGKGKAMMETETVVSTQTTLKIFPNPSASNFSVLFKTAKAGKISIGLYDGNGRLLSTIFTGLAGEGRSQQVDFKAGTLPSGTYIVRLQGQDEVRRQKLVITR
jgi:hypothetical protein